MNGISAFMKGAPESSLLHFSTGAQNKQTAVYELGRGPSPDPESTRALILDFQSPELGEMNFCCL